MVSYNHQELTRIDRSLTEGEVSKPDRQATFQVKLATIHDEGK
jgi:hypothetical protein